jgi:4,5-DOPA dioxygenase extradiol
MRMPTLFVGHGTPMNALYDNTWTRAFKELGKTLPRPTAIVSISGHFFTPGIFVTANERPPTVHDFGGFPKELYEIQYPCPGDPALAARIAALFEDAGELTEKWGLDHGTWSVLMHMYPEADIPTVQLSMDYGLDPDVHIALGRMLAPLRDEGILILGTGNLTHNLRVPFHDQPEDAPPPDYAKAFDEKMAKALEERDFFTLMQAPHTAEGQLNHPSPDHFLPLLYVAGAANDDEPVSYPITGFDRAFSMRAVQFG